VLDQVLLGVVLFYFQSYLVQSFRSQLILTETRDRTFTRYDWNEQRANPERMGALLMLLVAPIVFWCYFCGMESSPLQGTLGKKAVGIYVTDEQGQRVTFARATGRHFAKILSGVLLGIGFLVAGFARRKQAWHDFLSGCLVLRR
jgi:uncharacterized RDD family membrane protein YckC